MYYAALLATRESKGIWLLPTQTDSVPNSPFRREHSTCFRDRVTLNPVIVFLGNTRTVKTAPCLAWPLLPMSALPLSGPREPEELQEVSWASRSTALVLSLHWSRSWHGDQIHLPPSIPPPCCPCSQTCILLHWKVPGCAQAVMEIH